MEKIYKVKMNSKGKPDFSTAVEVVRCKDCFWHRGDKCKATKVMVDDDHYCGWGTTNEDD